MPDMCAQMFSQSNRSSMHGLCACGCVHEHMIYASVCVCFGDEYVVLCIDCKCVSICSLKRLKCYSCNLFIGHNDELLSLLYVICYYLLLLNMMNCLLSVKL